jgi:hypothetical protein
VPSVGDQSDSLPDPASEASVSRRAALSFLLLAALSPPAAAAPHQDTALKIAPGPKAISEEERALTDPAAAVILVDETSLDDSAESRREVRRHVRAKVLRNEGRDVADVEIPMVAKGDRLVELGSASPGILVRITGVGRTSARLAPWPRGSPGVWRPAAPPG